MKKINQKGFTPVMGLLIVAIVAIIGFAGWYVYISVSNTKKTMNSTVDSVPTPQKPTKKSSAPTNNSQTKYLVITEWGVKIPLNSGISDAVYSGYSIEGSQILNDEGEIIFAISKKTFLDISGSCNEAGGLLSRYKNPSTQIKGFEQTYQQRYGNSAIKIGDFYYYLVGPQSACGIRVNNNANPSFAQQTAATQAFSQAFRGIKAE